MLSSEAREFEGKALRTGDGGRVGTEVVVVIVVMFPAFCFESVEACRAYLSMLVRFWFEERWEPAPSPARDIAVESEPCCSRVRAREQSSSWSLTFDLSISEPLLTGSFSSFTDKCSNRASSVFVAIAGECYCERLRFLWMIQLSCNQDVIFKDTPSFKYTVDRNSCWRALELAWSTSNWHGNRLETLTSRSLNCGD